MSADHLAALLEKLTKGDESAATQVFREYEPYLRMVVRRQLSGSLRAKFDSSDIVQSIWVDVLQGFRDSRWRFQDAAHLRKFLVTVTRNRFLDRLRQQHAALAHEQPLTNFDVEGIPPSPQPRPSEIVQAEELWEQMLALCPPAHRELLRLKRQGASLDEIATQTGLHPSSVRRILYDLARRFTAWQKAQAAQEEQGLE
jgi:RNA polymerase sigma-70 factor (ECF subfamily)